MIRFENVTKLYPDGTRAVDDLTFEVAEGELVTLVGPSGCGKTTTMKMVNRLVEPTSGRIRVAGRDIADTDPVELRRRIGYVIQQVGLFPHRTVLENTATVPRLLGTAKAKARARAAELLDLVGLDPATYGDRYPHQLSGGQRQLHRRRPRARRRPSRPADGRAVRRRRPRRPGAAAKRVPPAPVPDAQDGAVRHPRPGGGGPARRPHGGLRAGPHRAARHARHRPRRPRHPLRRRVRRRRPRPQAARRHPRAEGPPGAAAHRDPGRPAGGRAR